MQRSLKPADIRAFIDRRWDLVKREKLGFLADRYQKGGASAARAAAQRLLRRWRSHHPNAFCDERRADDLASHIALKRQFQRASNAIRGY